MASALETLFGQAFGAKKYSTMGVYMQRSWIILFVCAVLLLPMYMFATPVLKLLGQPDDVAKLSGSVAIWMIPLHFAFAFQFPLQRFLQSQLKTGVIAWVSLGALIFHVFVSWLFVYKLHYGLIGTAVALNFSWWFLVFGMFAYTICGGCPLSWNGFSTQAFSGLWDFVKLSAASGVMICLENWYYRILILMTGSLKDAKIAVDALSVCQNINGLEMMIPLAFFAGTGVRVSNELGSGNGKAAKFATTVAKVINAVDRLGVLLAFTILLNSIQPVLSGVAVGSGWQGLVAYINIGSYYIIGLPLGILFGLTFHFGVMGIWSGMIGGTVVQTVILAIITIRCDWEKEAERVRSRMMKLATGNDAGAE